MPGWLPLFAPAVVQGTPNTPVISLTSPRSVTAPEMSLYGEWLVGDTYQFWRRAVGDEWSDEPTVTNTVLSGEINGTRIDFSLSPLPEGSYEYRFRNKHIGGEYSNHSPIESGTISFVLDPTYVAQVNFVGAPGASVVTADNISIGAPYANKRVYLFGSFTDVGNANTVAGITFNGAAATVYQSGTGADLRWAATMLLEGESSIDIELTFASGAFQFGHAALYTVDETLLSDIAPHATAHQHVVSGTSGVLNVATLDGGVCVFMGTLFGGAGTGLSITSSSDDSFVTDATGFAYLNSRAIGTQTRTAVINLGWDSTGDAYLTAWSLR